MRASFVVLALCAFAKPAVADSKTQELARGYEKELAGCRTRADGVTRVTTGTQVLVDGGQKQYEPDLAALRAGQAQVQEYCTELNATLEVLKDPRASYRSLERKLDEQDNKIRKLRLSTKKALDDLAPVISRMIPQINARVATLPAQVPKRVRIKFASGRAIDAPLLAGTYSTAGSEAVDILDYSEARTSATITVKLVASTTCEQQRQAIAAKEATEIAATAATKPLGLAWYIGYDKQARRVRAACRTATGGVILATLDEPAASSAWPDLEPVLIAMIAARS
ncbi:MAG TPA: hypothetical protein VFK02_08105 [Kofleriaceae bacterium]|nr:hypothetical protein [Kofleriaceae bacterium]